MTETKITNNNIKQLVDNYIIVKKVVLGNCIKLK